MLLPPTIGEARQKAGGLKHDTGCRRTEERKTRTLSAQPAERMRHPKIRLSA